MQTQQFNQAQEAFTKERLSTDIDLVKEVRDLLVNSGLMQEVINHYDTSNYILEASTLTPDGQRFLLNRYWNLQLLVVDAITVEERFCLITNGEFHDWLRLFKDKILPCAICHRLPTSLNTF